MGAQMSSYKVVGTSGTTDPTAVIAEAVSELLDRAINPQEMAAAYQKYFRDLTQLEFESGDVEFFTKALSKLQRSIVDESGEQLNAAINWNADLVTTVRISGAAAPESFDLAELPISKWVKTGIAEPDLLSLPSNKTLAIPANQVLFAVGAGAEYGPVKDWLALGGNFAAVMRPGFSRWKSMIEMARESGGTLLVPVLNAKLVNCGPNFLDDDDVLADLAGLDAVADLEAVSGWLREIASQYAHTTLGLWGYAPGPKHLVLQAAMDAIAETATTNLSPAELTLNWLGTPTDSVIINADSSPSLVDASVSMQGPNYLWAKRSQRLRAELAHRQGFRTAYLVLPPAYTNSVLSYKVLRIAYAGASAIGIHPFTLGLARRTALGLLLWVLHQPQPTGEAFRATRYAVTGGLWRLGSNPGWRWKWAVVFGLFRPWWLVKPGQKGVF